MRARARARARLLVAATAIAAIAAIALVAGCKRKRPQAFTAIWLEDDHGCGRVTSGDVVCWGGPHGNVPTVVPEKRGQISLPAEARTTAAGKGYTCALVAEGRVECKGANDKGQLGDGTTNASSAPVNVLGISGAVELAAGNAHTCARLKSGTLSCWGDNAFFQLADGTSERRTRAAPVQGLFGVAEIAAHGDGTCARLGSGEVRCWGNNDHGQLAPHVQRGVLNVPTPVRY